MPLTVVFCSIRSVALSLTVIWLLTVVSASTTNEPEVTLIVELEVNSVAVAITTVPPATVISALTSLVIISNVPDETLTSNSSFSSNPKNAPSVSFVAVLFNSNVLLFFVIVTDASAVDNVTKPFIPTIVSLFFSNVESPETIIVKPS